LNLDVLNQEFAADTKQELQKIIENDCTLVSIESLDQKQKWYNRMMQFLAYEIIRMTLFLFTFYFRQKGKG
jgi:cardiolipin synthase A/B